MQTCLRALVIWFTLLTAVPRFFAQVFPLQTTGNHIVDANGKRVRFNGVNWYGAEADDFVVTGLQYNTLPNIARLIHQMGYNVVRLPWSNQMYETNPVINSSLLSANPGLQGLTALQIFDHVIDALGAEGIMVIIDNHESDAGICCNGGDADSLWYNNNYPESKWISDWQGMTNRYATRAWVIGVDLRNELRGSATWTGTGSSGNPGTDWQSAAIRGGNAVLSINPHLLIFVEGLSNASDLSGVSNLPITLTTPNKVVYEAHDYSFFSGASNQGSYSAWLNWIGPRWGYLVTGGNPKPVWLGEFGTGHTSAGYTDPDVPADAGNWWSYVTQFITANSLDWTYWALNGTSENGNGLPGPTAPEGYGILDPTWSQIAESQLSASLQGLKVYSSGSNPALSITSVNDGTTGTGVNQFNFSGAWSSGANSGAFDGDNHWSTSQGASYSVAFSGTQALIYNAESDYNGIAAVSVDGGPTVNVDNYSGDTSGSDPIDYSVLVYASPILSNGPHTLTVRVTGNQNSSATGNTITADRVDVVAPTQGNTITSLNDSGSAFSYSGSWSFYSPQAGAFDNDNHYSSTQGASYTVTFSGSQATLYAATSVYGGIASVSVDGGTAVPVDTYASTTSYQVPIFSTFILPTGSHTLIVTVSGNTNPQAQADVITADRVDVVSP